jgi:hypothetical protein
VLDDPARRSHVPTDLPAAYFLENKRQYRHRKLLLSVTITISNYYSLYQLRFLTVTTIIIRQGFESIDAQTFADWGVDFLKEDSCYADEHDKMLALAQYRRMRDALNKTGRHVFFSLCGWHTW